MPSWEYLIFEEIPLTSALLYAGLDFILDANGHWVLLEVNDHPLGLKIADDFASFVGPTSVVEPVGVRALAQALVMLLGCRDKRGPVYLLLPEAYSVETATHMAPAVRLRHVHEFDDGRLAAVLAEFNRIALLVRALGTPCFIADRQAVFQQGGCIKSVNGYEPGVVYRRTYRFPLEPPTCPCVNDLRLRALCPDKLRTQLILEQFCPEVRMPRGFAISNENQSIRSMGWDSEFAIIKPNWGAASNGVERVCVHNSHSVPSSGEYTSGYLCQEWVEPSTVLIRGNRYYYDLRVLTVAGELVGCFARRAAAPREGVAADSPLSWLTTTGPAMPVVLTRKKCRANHEAVCLSRRQIEELKFLSRRVVETIGAAACDLDYCETTHRLHDIATLDGIRGELRQVRLDGCIPRTYHS